MKIELVHRLTDFINQLSLNLPLPYVAVETDESGFGLVWIYKEDVRIEGTLEEDTLTWIKKINGEFIPGRIIYLDNKQEMWDFHSMLCQIYKGN